MPAGMSWFAEYQPVHPDDGPVRGLLTGAPIGTSALLTIAWSVAITLLGYLWARRSYERISDP